MLDWRIRDARPDDREAIRRVNVANEPEVGPLDAARLELFTGAAARFSVVEADSEVTGLFVGLSDGLDYASPNYRWFVQRHARFAYVDRIALQPAVRGLGVADALYDDFERWARQEGLAVLCAEVNTVPANPRSLRFHERRGFVVVDEIAPYGGEERVAMLEKQMEQQI
ncbi:MAG: GNAT family N-acetyltransferase [Acidimicrobiales bacterium]